MLPKILLNPPDTSGSGGGIFRWEQDPPELSEVMEKARWRSVGGGGEAESSSPSPSKSKRYVNDMRNVLMANHFIAIFILLD